MIKHPNKAVFTRVIITFLTFILILNNFLFNLVNYIQQMGYQMGTICAPSYANMFMVQFDTYTDIS